VHRATLHDGRQVAIKVQRDKLKEMYDLDLPQFDKVTDMMDRFKIGVDAKTMFKDAKVILYREIDYTAEAENTRRLADAFKDEPWVKVPEIIDEFTTEKILTMEYVPGIKIDQVAKLDATEGIDRKTLGDNLAKAYLLQFCKYGVFNADPHPGNLAVDTAVPGGRIIIYDFGQVSYLTESQCDGILQVIQSIVDLDAKACVQAFDKLGAIRPGADVTALTAKIEDNFRTGKVKSRRSKRKADYVPEESDGKIKDSEVMKAFSLPSQLAFVARAITQMRGVGVMLDEEWEFIDIVAEEVPKLQMDKGAGIGYLADQFFKSLMR
jgi:aarF domain-containing kinase